LIILAKWFLYFIIYSFIGWLYESILCSISEKKWVNRGFLNGPLCPVYGFGALSVLFLLNQRVDNIVALFFISMGVTSILEYITSLLLEKLFHAKWWDYSNYRFNIQGRVSLIGAIVFGLLSVLLIKVIHPLTSELIIKTLSDTIMIITSSTIFIILIIDLSITLNYLFSLEGKLKEIHGVFNTFKNQYLKRVDELKDSIIERFEESELYIEYIKKLNYLNKFQGVRLVRAFPKLTLQKYSESWQKLKKILKEKTRKKQL